MLYTLQTMMDAPVFTWSVVLLMTGCVFWFLKTVVGSGGLALLFSPVLVFGGLASTYAFNQASIMLTPDKDTNAVAAAAIGIVATLILLIGLYWAWSLFSEARVRAKKVPHPLGDSSGR